MMGLGKRVRTFTDREAMPLHHAPNQITSATNSIAASA
ncbi:hypothetical protein MIZ03_2335 [Rhodoferax lithotrophicus]|uniref:Uncharacterized protein n=1 Tax=Rhodoferax lithotrophicus TaxID=2798804 RepID=A0ABN6D637_9BURK|nr:hypothetical protein MIZ03_2335 [Rhodoferax sp. MIZ03]